MSVANQKQTGPPSCQRDAHVRCVASRRLRRLLSGCDCRRRPAADVRRVFLGLQAVPPKWWFPPPPTGVSTRVDRNAPSARPPQTPPHPTPPPAIDQHRPPPREVRNDRYAACVAKAVCHPAVCRLGAPWGIVQFAWRRAPTTAGRPSTAGGYTECDRPKSEPLCEQPSRPERMDAACK